MSNFYKSTHLVAFQPAVSMDSPVLVSLSAGSNRHMQAADEPADACIFLPVIEILELISHSLFQILSSTRQNTQLIQKQQNQLRYMKRGLKKYRQDL